MIVCDTVDSRWTCGVATKNRLKTVSDGLAVDPLMVEMVWVVQSLGWIYITASATQLLRRLSESLILLRGMGFPTTHPTVKFSNKVTPWLSQPSLTLGPGHQNLRSRSENWHLRAQFLQKSTLWSLGWWPTPKTWLYCMARYFDVPLPKSWYSQEHGGESTVEVT